MRAMAILALFMAAATIMAGPFKTPSPNKSEFAVDRALAAAEKSGAIMTQSQIDSLLEQGKTKEALKAYFGREAKEKEVKEAAKKSTSAQRVETKIR
ncbi:MAG: hypothetical protein R6X19_08565 [Kiritimatiellia bacterium]